MLSAFTITRSCESCGGTGTVETTRERRLEELTSTQMDFLYKAQLERKKAEKGVDKDGQSVSDVTSNANLPANPSNMSVPNGGPPMNGPARRF